MDGVGEAAREEAFLGDLRGGPREQPAEPDRDEADDDQDDHQQPRAHAYSAGEVVPVCPSGTPSR